MLLIAAGVVAIPIPVMPGIPLLAAGAAILGSDHALVRSGRTWLRNLRILTQGKNQNELSNMQS